MGDTDPIIVDVRGLSCPQPVIATRRAILAQLGGNVQVLVDTGTQRDNVSRLARHEGWVVAVEPAADGFRILLSK